MDLEPVTTNRINLPQKVGSFATQPVNEYVEIVFDFSWFLQVLIRHWLASLLIFSGTLFLSLVFFLKDPPEYEATSRLKIVPKRTVFNIEQLTAFDLFSLEFYQTQIKLLQSRTLVREVIQALGPGEFQARLNPQQGRFDIPIVNRAESSALSSDPAVSSGTMEIEAVLINRYIDSLRVAPDRQATQIISLTFRSTDPVFAAKVANTHAEVFIGKNTQSNVVYTADYIVSLEKLIAEADIQIATQNEEILNFKKEHGFFQLQGISSFDPVQDIDDRLSRVREQMAVANEKLTKTEAEYESLFLPGKIGDMDAVRADVLTSVSLDQLRNRRNELMQAWAEIKDKYGDRHPAYVSTKSKLDTVNQTLREEIGIHVQRAKTAHDEALSTKNKLVEEEQSLIQEKYRRDSEWNTLKSMEKAKEQLEQQRVKYIQDLQNARSSRDTQEQTQNRTYEIVDRAEAPTRAANRNWFKILLLSFAAALSLTLTGVLLIELQDRTIRTPQQIEQMTGISIMGCIPQYRAVSSSHIVGRIDEHDSQTPAGEAYIGLRTRFLFSDMISHTQTVLITSAMKGEGKSTVAVNLASSLSLVGKRVVLVDCDLRKPTLHRFFGEPREPGFTDAIDDLEVLESVLFETDLPGLFILPAGTYTPSPTEALTSTGFDELIEQLKKDFDFVILDSPSVLATPDPTILAPRIDTALLVVRSGKIVKDDLVSTLDHFRQTGGSIYAIILNGVPAVERGAYARYGYGQSYYYESKRETSSY